MLNGVLKIPLSQPGLSCDFTFFSIYWLFSTGWFTFTLELVYHSLLYPQEKYNSPLRSVFLFCALTNKGILNKTTTKALSRFTVTRFQATKIIAGGT